jgi:hypothetical protein
VGAKPERLSFEAEMPSGRWQAVCGNCGMRHHKHRRPKHLVGWWCCRCGPERGRLVWGLAHGTASPGSSERPCGAMTSPIRAPRKDCCGLPRPPSVELRTFRYAKGAQERPAAGTAVTESPRARSCP